MEEGRKITSVFYVHTSFWCLKKIKPFWGTTKKCENKNCIFFLISINYFRMLGTGWVKKFFLLGYFKKWKQTWNLFLQMYLLGHDNILCLVNIHWNCHVQCILFALKYVHVGAFFVIKCPYVNEHLVVPFVELTRDGSFVSHLCFLCLHRITCLSIPMVTQA